MKKIYAIAALCACSFLVSCQKENNEKVSNGVKFVEKTFTATIVDVDSRTKAVTDGIKTYWKTGDKLSVSNSTPSAKVLPADAGSLTAQSDGLTTTFKGTVADGLEKYVAVYPYASVTNWNNSATAGGYNAASGRIKGASTSGDTTQAFEIVNTVDGKNIYMDPACMYLGGVASSADYMFEFRHILAYIMFTVPEGYQTKIKNVQIWDSSAAGGAAAHKIQGTFNMNGNTNWAAASIGSSSANTLVAKMADGTRFAPGVYYIPVLPRTSTDNTKNYYGLNVKFVNTDKSDATKSFYKASVGSLAPGKVYDMGVIPEMLDELGK